MSGKSTILPQSEKNKVNPFSLSDEEISTHIIASHNPKAETHDVDYLYDEVSNIIKEASSGHINDKHIALKHGESKVSQSKYFLPTFHTLKDISSQIVSKSFDAYIAHETIMQILQKLRKYNWATKGVTTLAAFALDYGEPWQVSKMAPTKENSLEIHISGGEGLERPADAITNYRSFVVPAMQLIKLVVDLENLIVKKHELLDRAKDISELYIIRRDIYHLLCAVKDMPELYEVPQDIYTYWAIFALLACAGWMASDLKSELSRRINTILNDFARQWKRQIGEITDYLWRLNVFRFPSGVLQLLMALICPRDIPYLQIYDNTHKCLVKPEELKTKYLLLFISGVGIDIESCINVLDPIHKSFMMDPKKNNYRILWVPVEDGWDEKRKQRFNVLKSIMPWYIVEYLEPIKGFTILKEMYKYQEMPVVMVVDPQGNILHPDAWFMIKTWDEVTAFPFTQEREKQLCGQYLWFWQLLVDVAQPISKWIKKGSFIFISGGRDVHQVKEFAELLERIRRESQGVVEIVHYNLEETLEKSEKFWAMLTYKFQERILNRKDGDEGELLEMEMLLAMKTEKIWTLFSKGLWVLAVDYGPSVSITWKEFIDWKEHIPVDWKEHIPVQEFDKAFIDHYHMRRSRFVSDSCYLLELENPFIIPHNIICPKSDCKLKMKIKSIGLRCCHDKHNQRLKGISEKDDEKPR